VTQLARTPRDPDRFAKIAASDLFEPEALEVSTDGALHQRQALVIEPAAVLRAWIGTCGTGEVSALARDGDIWRLLDGRGETLAEAEIVVLCAGMVSAVLADLPLRAVRGQASWASVADPPGALAWGGYAVPTRDGMLFGATHDRDDTGVELREADHARNLATLAEALPALAASLRGIQLDGRASTRATTYDRLPIAGALAPGLFALTGLGSRGFSFAPLLAEHIAAEALGAPSPLPSALAALVAPERFSKVARASI
jgi:tRNA 5-methylaminomethyl-2-thiouridine biosynthesis bifunctional protein